MTEPSERELVERARHDPGAFAALYDRYVDRIYRYACRLTGDPALAQDITAVTFEKALGGLDRFQWQGSSLAAWLYRIAHNEAVRHWHGLRFLAVLSDRQPASLDVEAVIQSNQQSAALRAAFARLPHADQELLTLRFIEDLSSAEVAHVLRLPVQRVYLRLHRALERLRLRMREEEEGGTAYAKR